ncbi:MAG TPA: Crp/Fnr family transcriptional regulator [Eubacteriales bacterium]|nr:Crp/Fnr family transcriptional regulator [Eubacteriales bacterium]
MELGDYLPIWSRLTQEQRTTLENATTMRIAPKGTMLHNGNADCVGLFVVKSGQLRAFIVSDEGKEVTLYRLLERDICLFSAACMMSSIRFEVTIEAEKDSEVYIIPTEVYHSVMEESTLLANYTSQILASRFSEVMWLMDQILFKRFDARLATFLLEESAIEDSDELEITHEKIANHMGTAREVVTRMLKYFQSEGMVSLTRGAVHLLDREKLTRMAD